MKRIVWIVAVVFLAAGGRALAQEQEPGMIENGTFDAGLSGWTEYADHVMVKDGKEIDSDRSYFRPTFKLADDIARQINGPTLQIDAVEFAKWRGGVYQRVNVRPGAKASFTFVAAVFSLHSDNHSDLITVRAGLNARGAGCTESDTHWKEVSIGHLQQQGVSSPEVVATAEGVVTVCIFGEPRYPFYKNALFVDDVSLTTQGGMALPPAGGVAASGAAVALAATPTPAPPPDPAFAGLVPTPVSPDPAPGSSLGTPAQTGGSSPVGWLAACGGLAIAILITARRKKQ